MDAVYVLYMACPSKDTFVKKKIYSEEKRFTGMSRKILRILGIFLFKNKKVEMNFRAGLCIISFHSG